MSDYIAPCAAMEKIQMMLDQVDKKDGKKLVSTMDQVMQLLEYQGLAWSQRIRPQQVGVEPSNRDGVGVNAEDVHSLGADIFAMGWSWSQVASAVCVEEAPGASTIADFNRRLSSSCDILPSDGFDQIRFDSVACSHTNMFLKCLSSGVKSNCEGELTESGCLSLEKVGRTDPEFARAAREGLEWKVLSSKVPVHFPRLLSLLQRARNAPQQIARAEHEVQVMLRMHALAALEQERTGQIRWDVIRRQVAIGRPPCVNYLRELTVFIAVCGGGVDGAFLKDLAAFHGQFVDSSKCIIRGPFLQALAELDLEAPYLKIAFLKAQYGAPLGRINRALEPTFITTSDPNKVVRDRKPMCVEANTLLSKLRSIFKKAGIEKLDANVSTKLTTRLDIMVARYMLNKQQGVSETVTSSGMTCVLASMCRVSVASTYWLGWVIVRVSGGPGFSWSGGRERIRV